MNVYDLTGTQGDPIGDGLNLNISNGNGAENQYGPSEIAPNDANASMVFDYIGNVTSPVWANNSVWDVPATLDVGDRASPALVDLDDDGDYDMLTGENNGFCYGRENTGNATEPIWSDKNAWDNTNDVGIYATPVFADLDGDNDYDLIVGNDQGFFAGDGPEVFENIGSVTRPNME